MMEYYLILFFLIMVNLLEYKYMILMSSNLCFFLFFIYLFKMNSLLVIGGWSNLSFYFGLNFYSYGLILLVYLILGLMLSSIKNIKLSEFCVNIMMFLLLNLMMTFMSMNLFMFYLMFEVTLIPTFLLVIFWGMSFGRFFSSYYMFFYMIFFSVPMLIYLFYLNNELGCLMLYLLLFMKIDLNLVMIVMMLLSFLVKVPMFLMHSWLLKAHVEAPVFGSMILAALLLKMGGYGILLILKIMYYLVYDILIYLISLSLMGSLILSVVCLRQIDMKLIVAYSSVVHMGLMISGLMTLLKFGFLGAYVVMIAHGLCSSGMFYMVNMFYERTGSRLLMINKGLINFIPSMSLLWFMLCSSNMSAPLSLNLVGEIFLLISLVVWEVKLILMLMLICFLSFLYSLYLFSYSQFGNIFLSKNMIFNMGSVKEFLNLIMHWIPLNLIILNLFLF